MINNIFPNELLRERDIYFNEFRYNYCRYNIRYSNMLIYMYYIYFSISGNQAKVYWDFHTATYLYKEYLWGKNYFGFFCVCKRKYTISVCHGPNILATYGPQASICMYSSGGLEYLKNISQYPSSTCWVISLWIWNVSPMNGTQGNVKVT